MPSIWGPYKPPTGYPTQPTQSNVPPYPTIPGSGGVPAIPSKEAASPQWLPQWNIATAAQDQANQYNNYLDQMYGSGGDGGSNIQAMLDKLALAYNHSLENMNAQKGRITPNLNITLRNLGQNLVQNLRQMDNSMLNRNIYGSGIQQYNNNLINRSNNQQVEVAKLQSSRSMEDVDRMIRQATENYNFNVNQLTG